MKEFKVAKKPYRIAVIDRILDSVHGQIGLTPVEHAIERLPIFKRLHNISQLGLVNRIFPCAVHTRYSHSLGVMHVASLMTESINGKFYKSPEPFFCDDCIQVIRLAGLLHDIGHYPMSHNIEMAYKERLRPLEPVRDQLKTYVNCPKFLYPHKPSEPSATKNPGYLKSYSGSQDMHHEYIGYKIIINNRTLFEAVKDNYVLIDDGDGSGPKLNPFYHYKEVENATYNTKEINKITKNIMTTIGHIVIGNYSLKDAREVRDHRDKKNRPLFNNYSAMVQLIHSEMDADNIDYLLRDATFSGTTYGTMDMSMLISNLTVSELEYEYESNGVLCKAQKYLIGILKKRAGCVEQFLLSKYMAYGQVVYSKYVSILEAMLFRVACKLITEDGAKSKYGRAELKKLVQDKDTRREYLDFNDSYIMNRISAFVDNLGTYSVCSPDREMFIQLIDNLAFDVEKETSSVNLERETLIKNIKETPLYKDFSEVCNKLESKTEKECLKDRALLLKDLMSYRFESYNLTKQLPYDLFLETLEEENGILCTPELLFKAHYYRLATGIPVFEKNDHHTYHYSYDDETSEETRKDPPLIVDTKSSLLHEIYPLGFVYLRKYKLENKEPSS